MTYRTKFLDYDARRDPKTDRFCIRCQKDIKPDAEARAVHIVDGGSMILHPADESAYQSDNADLGFHLIGPECSRVVGIEWTHPPR